MHYSGLIDHVLANEPRELDVHAYTRFAFGLVEFDAMGYVDALERLIGFLRILDDTRDTVGLPPRPQWQTIPDFLHTVGKRNGAPRARGGDRNWGPRASGGSSSSNIVSSLSADDIMRGRNGGGGGHAPPAAAGGGTRPARYDAGAAVQRQGGGGNAGPARYNAAEMMQRRGAR